MAYIGSSAALVPVSFSTPDSQAFNGNDSSTVFTLSRSVVTTTQLEIIVNNVQQSPYDGSYSVSGTTLTFSEAPSTGIANVYVNYRDQAIGTITDETRVAKTGDTMSGPLIINGELFVNSNEINLDDLQSLSWGDGSVQVRGNGTAETLELRTNAATRVFVDSSGNVGIGTSSPNFPLSFGANIGKTFALFENAGTSVYGIGMGGAGSSGDPYRTKFFSNGAERMAITDAGDVLVGKTSGASAVTVQGINLRDTGQIVANTGASGSTPLYVCRDANGDAIVFFRDGAVRGEVVVNTSSVSYNTTSDYRLKENVTSFGNASSRVLQLNPVRFNFIGDSDTVDGFLAHEAQAVVPEAVTGEKDAVNEDGSPNYQGIDQSKLVPLLTAALQEALAKIDDLTARVSALETA